MLIEDENESANIFARKRLTYNATATVISCDDALWSAAINELEQRFGRFVRELESFNDFHLFRLEISDGLFIKGFGQAFRLSGETLADLSYLIDGHNHDTDAKSA